MKPHPAPPTLIARLKSPGDLHEAMRYARYNVRTLAAACGNSRYRSTIGHLHSGVRSTCSVHLASRIESACHTFPGALFALESRSGSTDAPTAAVKARKAA